MKERLEKRLADLRDEREMGQKQLAQLDERRRQLVLVLTRIEGAIQVLIEELERDDKPTA